jgi:hypothetical protein
MKDARSIGNDRGCAVECPVVRWWLVSRSGLAGSVRAARKPEPNGAPEPSKTRCLMVTCPLGPGDRQRYPARIIQND